MLFIYILLIGILVVGHTIVFGSVIHHQILEDRRKRYLKSLSKLEENLQDMTVALEIFSKACSNLGTIISVEFKALIISIILGEDTKVERKDGS